MYMNKCLNNAHTLAKNVQYHKILRSRLKYERIVCSVIAFHCYFGITQHEGKMKKVQFS